MYEITNGSRYSFFSIHDDKANYQPIVTHDKIDQVPSLKLQLKELETEENYLETLYSSCMDNYQSTNTLFDNMETSTQNDIINRISSINARKRELDKTKRILLERLDFCLKNEIKSDIVIPHTFNNSRKSESPKISFWSLDLFNYISSRTLNKRKYLSPDFLLREPRLTYGHYNYTYFNDQLPEEAEIFDHMPKPQILPSVPPVQVAPRPVPTTLSRVININDIINRSIDSRHVIIIRGLPGSGKSTFCQAFKEKEIANNRSPPRILSIDHFFVDEGKFDYVPDLEPVYRHELFKLFKRQIDEGFFSVILLDCINEKVEQFSQFYQYGMINRFQVCVLELKVSPVICAKRSEDRFTTAQVYKMAEVWEETPNFYDRLDATSLLQDSSIQDVEMEDIVEMITIEDESESDEDSLSETGFFKSKWDEDFEDTKERLDGVKPAVGHDTLPSLSIREYLRIEIENLNKSNIDDKTRGKKVTWADFEELKKQKKRRELGFVAGGTDWNKLMSNDIDVAEAALVQVRYFTKDTQ